MALPRIEAVITADTKQAEAGFDRVERGLEGVGSAADRARTRTASMGTALNRTAGRSSAFGRGIQNASFQIGDFATQVGAGTNASIALGQQLPQLLGGFGILGAVIGAVVAIAVPMTRAFSGMASEGQELSRVLGVLEPLAGSVADAFRTVAQAGIVMAEVVINNLDRILITAGAVAGFFAGRWVVSFVAARVATFSLAGALATLRGALIRTGFGAIIVGVGELIYQFTRLVQATGSVGAAFGVVQEAASEAFRNIDILAQALWDGLSATALSIAAAFLDAFDRIRGGFAKLVNFMLQSPILEALGVDLGQAAEDWIKGGDFGDEAGRLREQAGSLFGSSASGFNQAIPSLQKIKDLLASVKDEKITLPDLLGVGGGDDEGEDGGKSATEKLDEELTAQEQRIKEHFDRIKALTQGGLSDKLGAWGDYFGNLVSLTGTQNKKLLGLQKSFAAAQALIDAWSAHNKVLADPTLPWWARIASAASVLAAGIGAVNAIRSVSESGGAVSGGASSGGGASSAAAAPAPRNVYVDLQGDTFSADSVRQTILTVMQDEIDRGGQVIFGGAR